MKTRMSRRTLLRGATGLAVGLPFLQAMEARAQAAAPKRLVIFFSPDGFNRATWAPTNVTSETQFTLSPTLTPLQAFRQKLLILDNLDQKVSEDSVYGNSGHDRGMAGLLTGTKTSSKRIASGISIDQAVANRIGAPAGGFKCLTLGVQTGNVTGFSRIHFSGPDAPVTPQENPREVFDRLVAASSTDAAALKLRAKRARVADEVLADYRSLRNQLGPEDRNRLETHLASLSTLEKEVDQVAAACSLPTLNFSGTTFPQLLKLQTDLLVTALKCDLTRVATLQASKSVSRVVPNWLTFNGKPITKEHHDLTHPGDAADDIKMLPLVDKWYAEQFAYLLASMDAVPEGNGTMLDNSVVVWCSEFGLGISHDVSPTPFVLAGGCGGQLRTGRYVRFPTGTHHNRLLVTLDRLMGGTAEKFGDPDYAGGVLAGLMA